MNLYNNGLYQEALDALLSEDIDPVDDPELAYLMGLCYTRLEEFSAAVFYLEKATERDISLIRVFQCRMVLSYVYNITRDFKSAEKQLKKVLEDGFESCQIFTSLGYALWSQKKVEESIDFLSRSLEMDPDNANTLNSMGYIMADEGINPEKAVEYCHLALSFQPDNGNYLDSLAWALFRTGKLKEARNYAERALDAGADKSVCREHLNMIDQYDKF
ncbi:tetratricopeptide repeat protein [Oceanispirochaeta sp.]|uniref:tetratricopeptide repeat protein n=1 Tax=Oceanispirochaeta sp. TaxID=2035350 RepID=UPI0026040230|nr:tetratricopeptide repeat protein [Oceanispirochaeta sp.]MDA3956305.1 tetratricopeptide repeat protein [Oceanispirochaeta sp.]